MVRQWWWTAWWAPGRLQSRVGMCVACRVSSKITSSWWRRQDLKRVELGRSLTRTRRCQSVAGRLSVGRSVRRWIADSWAPGWDTALHVGGLSLWSRFFSAGAREKQILQQLRGIDPREYHCLRSICCQMKNSMLWTLSGLRLVCHCTPALGSHCDVIIREFGPNVGSRRRTSRGSDFRGPQLPGQAA